MEEYSKLESKEIPQIHSKTGISQDYANQFNILASLFKMKGISGVKDILIKIPFHMEKYEKVYSDYKNIVNDKNRDTIKKLDELAIHMNEVLKNPDSIDENDFRKTCNELYFLIYGDKNISI